MTIILKIQKPRRKLELAGFHAFNEEFNGGRYFRFTIRSNY